LTEASDAQPLAERLLTLMAQQRADFTRVFAGLADGSARDEFLDRDAFDAWHDDWQAQNPDADLMRHANPLRIPRNHRVEEAIAAAVAGDMAPFKTLFDAVTHPREARSEWSRLADAPLDEQIVRQTFCGT
jgi:serine/tyrosine/threonine adenylyltransferase